MNPTKKLDCLLPNINLAKKGINNMKTRIIHTAYVKMKSIQAVEIKCSIMGYLSMLDFRRRLEITSN